jgi:isocitrate dehydrogenase (NAD+)
VTSQGTAKTHSVTLVPGDGIGPEVTAAARQVLEATGVQFDWDVQHAGARALEAGGAALPPALVESVRARGLALKGPVATPVGSGFRSVNVALRDALELYVGVRPCRSLAGAPTRFPTVDVVVIRMTGEDLYAGIEFVAGEPGTGQLLELIAERDGSRLADDVGISVKPLARSSALRVAHAAFRYARSEGRATVTAVHKATVMRATDGVFLDAAREAAGEFPDVRFDERLVDATCHDLVVRPESFDVLLAPVMYGDLLADLCAGLIGGLGLAPGASYGDGCAVFEPVHGTAMRLAGTNTANPMATILSGAMLLRHVGEAEAAKRVEAAVGAVVEDGSTLTYDLRPGRQRDGAATTQAVAGAVVAALG